MAMTARQMEATKLARLIRREPGMADQLGWRAGGCLRTGGVIWAHPSRVGKMIVGCSDGCIPDLADPSTLGVLWGQLRRRFAACGWTVWQRDYDPRVECGVLVRRPNSLAFESWDGAETEVLLAGYRKVTELEEKNAET